MEIEHRRLSRKLLAVFVVGGIVLVSLLVAVIVLASKSSNQDDGSHQPSVVSDEDRMDLLSYFRISDGLRIKWFHGLTSEVNLDMARSGKFHVLNIKVTKSQAGLIVDGGTLRLRQLLNAIKNDNFAVNLYASKDTRMGEIVRELQQSQYNKPVVFSVPVLSRTNPLNLTEFVQLINELNTKTSVGVNFDMTSHCCEDPIGIGIAEYIADVIKTLDVATTVEIHGAILKRSWSVLKWLLDKSDQLKLVLSANQGWNTTVRYGLLLVRNDADMHRVFYNLATVAYEEFVSLASTAGSPLIYFDIHPRDAGKVIWSHNTDTWELINKATTGDTMMVEGDIRLDPVHNVTIMAHDLGDNNNLTFQQWLEEIIKVKKGVKFDFKELHAVAPALEIVKSRRHDIKGPLWANADILPGPGGKPTKIPALDFLRAIFQGFPGVTLSLGWTTIQKGRNYTLHYTMPMVNQMHNVCKDLLQPVTFPVRAEQVLYSYEALDWLLRQSRGYTLTIWTAHGDNVTKADMVSFKQKFEMSRVYFDLPEELRPSFDSD